MFLQEIFEHDDDTTASLAEAVRIAFVRRGHKIARTYHRDAGEVDGEARQGMIPKRRFVAKRVKTVGDSHVAAATESKPKPSEPGNPLSLRVQRQNTEKD